MATQHKIIVTRPNLTSLFWLEHVYSYDTPIKWAPGTMPPELEAMKYTAPLVPMCFPAWLPGYYADHQMANKTGFTSFVIDDLLTWTQILARKDELRPDLLDLTESEYFRMYMLETAHANYHPPVNPFSTTWTAIGTWDTLENMQAGVGQALEEMNLVSMWNDSLTHTNNTLVEEVYVDGVKQTGIAFFS